MVPTFFFRGYKTVTNLRVIFVRLLRSALRATFMASKKFFFESFGSLSLSVLFFRIGFVDSKNYLKNFLAPRAKVRFLRRPWAGRRPRARARAGAGPALGDSVRVFDLYATRCVAYAYRLRVRIGSARCAAPCAS